MAAAAIAATDIAAHCLPASLILFCYEHCFFVVVFFPEIVSNELVNPINAMVSFKEFLQKLLYFYSRYHLCSIKGTELFMYYKYFYQS